MATFTIDVERPKKRSRIDASTESPDFAASADYSSLPVHERERRFRELYLQPPDFKDLARRDEELRPMVKGREVDFKDPAVVMQLTKTLLRLDFGLRLEMPGDRLCPPVANRHNYILWLKALLDSTDESVYDEDEDLEKLYEKKVKGLDIGTGASCVYPLLGCAQRPNWHFAATDIDAKSLEYAQTNIDLNNLSSRVTLLPRSSSDPLIPPSTLPLDFTMTNPPFYTSPTQLSASAAKKSLPPLTACIGAPNEMVTPGGEVGFINRIIDESLVLRGQVRWYTTMVGFLSSLSAVVERLKEEGVVNYAVTEFVQGKKTRRWAVGWSFGDMRASEEAGRGISEGVHAGAQGKGGNVGFARTLLPSATEVEVVKLPGVEDIEGFSEEFRKKMETLELRSWKWGRGEGVGRAGGRVWGRAWRRAKKQVEVGKMTDEEMREKVPEEVFGFKVQVRGSENGVAVWVRWLEGREQSAFESFTGFVKASAEAAKASST